MSLSAPLKDEAPLEAYPSNRAKNVQPPLEATALKTEKLAASLNLRYILTKAQLYTSFYFIIFWFIYGTHLI